MFIFGMLLGAIIGMFIIAVVSLNSLNEEIDAHFNAEYSAVTHFRKLQAIERILENAKETNEPAVFTVDKIKEVITSDQPNQ